MRNARSAGMMVADRKKVRLEAGVSIPPNQSDRIFLIGLPPPERGARRRLELRLFFLLLGILLGTLRQRTHEITSPAQDGSFRGCTKKVDHRFDAFSSANSRSSKLEQRALSERDRLSRLSCSTCGLLRSPVARGTAPPFLNGNAESGVFSSSDARELTPVDPEQLGSLLAALAQYKQRCKFVAVSTPSGCNLSLAGQASVKLSGDNSKSTRMIARS